MNPVFPATYSTLSPLALAAFITEQYGLSDVGCEFLLRGVGDTYRVESSSGRYILRVYRSSHRNRAQIRTEVDLLLALQRAGVSVSCPIPALSGESIQSFEAAEGQRQAVLFSYAPGRSFSQLSAAQLRSLGHEMARFHIVSSGFEPASVASASHTHPSVAPATLAPGGRGERWLFDMETTLFRPLEKLKPFFAADPAGFAWLQQAAKQVENKLGQLDVSGFSTGYCHFDFLPKNFHFEGDSVTFFDFDFLGYGWLVNDIMTFWQHLRLDVHFGRTTEMAADEDFAGFLKAYREHRPLSQQELEAVPYLSLGFWLFYMGFHTTHDQFFPFIQPDHLKLRLGLVQQLMKKSWPLPFPAPAFLAG
jgi:Ser/Thr protein kinase RdoA (MazF antagonist)